ncbi:M81 family metallopeptidase [Oceanicella sp. SM1341]|uniref:M81 family metallopeptidase n=1 Tax=Oceanicella sp. SM1341 TaxID=1548889 RepID=UPI000E4D257D|nr:M81 family metallopeptidase [Oceanicella sp. SM1341]
MPAPSTAPRIAVGGFLHETNTFGPSKATYEDFASGGGSGRMVEGEAILGRARGMNAAIAGAIEAGEARGWDMIPTLWCATSPSAHVTEDAFERISARMLELIEAALPLDGIFLDLHGAMVTEHLDDGEGELLRRLREIVGPDMPVVVALDLHANVTPLMVETADVLESYRTYPHVDMAETGRRGAAALATMIGTGSRPGKAFLEAPFLTAIAWQCTDMEPAKGLYAKMEELARDQLTMSFNMGFPAADFPGCGMTVLAYGAGADTAAREMMKAVEAAEAAFAGRVYTPEEGIAEARRLAAGASRPVILSDTQDNPGAGADSDTTGMLRALIAEGGRAAIGNLYDPESARAAHAAGLGATVRLSLGAKSAIPGDAPLEAEFVVEALTDGAFLAKGPYYLGRMMNMGPSACLRIGDVRIALTSAKAQMADREMFRTLGIIPEEEPLLVVKSSVHFRADFAPIAEEILVCAAPGPMAVDPALLPWTRLRPGLRMRPHGPVFQPAEQTSPKETSNAGH